MKIEKGKLYYNHQLECVIKASVDSEDKNGIHSDKVAVLCYNEQHIEYIMILLGNVNYNRPYVFINEKYGEPHGCIGYHVITIDQFKEFYQSDEEQFPYVCGSIDISGKNKEDKPAHYSKGIDTFARMEANCTKEECLAFIKGNIDKYNWREKGQDLEDFDKIISYAKWAKSILNKNDWNI